MGVMNGDRKKGLEAGPDSSPNLWSRVRSGLGHVGLFLTLMIYTAVGGMVSRLFVHFTRKQCFFFKFNIYYALCIQYAWHEHMGCSSVCPFSAEKSGN